MIFSSPRSRRWASMASSSVSARDVLFTRQKSSGSPASGSPGRVRPWERGDASTVLICRTMSIRRVEARGCSCS